ncbi:MAG: hypothetical protein WAW09_02865, partial [Smithella sp.]
DCASSFVTAAYAKVGLIPQYSRALSLTVLKRHHFRTIGSFAALMSQSVPKVEIVVHEEFGTGSNKKTGSQNFFACYYQ